MGGTKYKRNTYIGLLILLATVYILYNISAIKDYIIGATEGFSKTVRAKGFIVNPIGGLGNQLFIYAGGLAVSRKFQIPLYILPIDNDTENKNIHSNTDYRYLFKEASPIDPTDARAENATEVSFKAEIIYGLYDLNELPVEEPVYIHVPYHYYQNYRIVKDVIPDIRDYIVPQLKQSYGDLKVDTRRSAFIHVRRGDYLSSGGGYRLLDMDYYRKGMGHLNGVQNIQRIYIISDDIAWCKQQEWSTKKELVYFDDPDELKTLYLMSQCWAGAVISNSTFSCWGAFLGSYELAEKIVYPSKSFMDSLPESWIKI